jgi:class 3 adenylate cyclase/pimeloyl-ACP methyl ester carboxylesterase
VMDRPDTQFAWNGDVALAFQVIGDGSAGILYLPGILTNVDVMWENPNYARFLQRLATFSRLVVMDRRGYGCSERFSPRDVAPLEVHIEDAIAVLDAANLERAAVLTYEEANFLAAFLAAARPERISQVIFIDPAPTWMRDDEISWEWSAEQWEDRLQQNSQDWGRLSSAKRDDMRRFMDDREIHWTVRFERATQGPGAMVAETRKFTQTDIRAILPTIHVPALVIHQRDDPFVDERSSRYVAEHIQGATYIELPGSAHYPWEEWERLTDEIQEFITGTRGAPHSDRVLTTVLFTDIVASTQTAARLGDAEWHRLLGRHHAIVRAEIVRFEGVEQDTAGDGFYITLDGPARAVQCAKAIVEGIAELGLQVRAGIHTGECEFVDGKASGIATVIGSRVMSNAGPSEILVSQTVKDLVAGSGLSLEEKGMFELKGIPETWRLYNVSG